MFPGRKFSMNFFQSRRVACAAPTRGSLALPQPKGACVAPTKGWFLVAEFDGNCWELLEIVRNYWKLLEIIENCWKLLRIAKNCWKLLNISENPDNKYSRPESCSKFSKRFFELFPPGKFHKKDSKQKENSNNKT